MEFQNNNKNKMFKEVNLMIILINTNNNFHIEIVLLNKIKQMIINKNSKVNKKQKKTQFNIKLHNLMLYLLKKIKYHHKQIYLLIIKYHKKCIKKKFLKIIYRINNL